MNWGISRNISVTLPKVPQRRFEELSSWIRCRSVRLEAD